MATQTVDKLEGKGPSGIFMGIDFATTPDRWVRWKPKMKYKYSRNAFCGCSDYIIGKEPRGFDGFVTDRLAYMRAANRLTTKRSYL